MDLARDGWGMIRPRLGDDLLEALRREAFAAGSAGTRCLLGLPSVGTCAIQVKRQLIEAGILPTSAVAIQAIGFDKTPDTNWKVAWHQDLMFPFAQEVSSPGYDLSSCKSGVHYARPPLGVLEDLLAVRLHLDDCTESNGPLRLSPGTHSQGIIPSDEVAARVVDHGEIACLAANGEARLMRPLLLHASSKATAPGHRRVLHLVYHTGGSMPEAWHRCL